MGETEIPRRWRVDVTLRRPTTDDFVLWYVTRDEALTAVGKFLRQGYVERDTSDDPNKYDCKFYPLSAIVTLEVYERK